MMLAPAQILLGAGSGGLVGFTLGLVGGGGSILAVPLMVYLVGVPNPHMAIGTSALAVAVNAATGLISHARAHTVKWRCGAVYAAAGIMGAFAGAAVGKAIDGQKLLFLFALLMVVVGVTMLRKRAQLGNPAVEFDREKLPKLLGYGLGTGLFSGFFGIGGGFLIVPGLMRSTGMPILNAIGTSLLAVTAFGLTTALSYALTGLVDWQLAAVFIGGGILGGILGSRLVHRLSAKASTITIIFSGFIFAIAAYMLWKSAQAI